MNSKPTGRLVPRMPDEDFEEKNKIAQTPAATSNAPAVDNPAQPVTKIPQTNVDDLPDEVKKNLIGFEKMEQEQLLMKVMNAPGAIYTVDKIILDLWLKHNIKDLGRMLIIQRLRSLVHQGLVHKQPKARGIYSLTDAGRTLLAGAALPPGTVQTQA